MTPQLVALLLIPFFLIVDIYAVVSGRRGSTRTHKLARVAGIAALITLAIFVVTLIDLVTQVWVMRLGSISREIYATSGIGFAILSLASLVLCVKLYARRD